jgi:glycosyltransferase involved in cell wall biosynthesis
VHVLGGALEGWTAHVRMVSALARGLDSERYQVKAWLLGYDGPLSAALRAAGVEVRQVKWPGSRHGVGIARFARALRSEDVAIVHQHAGGALVPLVAGWTTKAKRIVHLHGVVSDEGHVRSLRRVIRASDVAVAVSHAVADAVGQPSIVIHGFATARERERPTWRTEDAPVLGLAGRLSAIKGVDHAIRAFALVHRELPDLRMEVAGSGPEAEALAAQARNLGIASHVRFLGWQRDLPPLFDRWSLFVQASLYEGFPLSVVEAMGSGLPVVASRVGGMLELVEHGSTGLLFPPADARALAEAVRRLLADAELRRSMGDAARDRVRTCFSEARFVSSVSDLYDRLLA